MNENEMRATLELYEAKQGKGLEVVLARRKTALRIVMSNLVKDIEVMPATAQDVIAVYSEIVSKLYSELENLN